MSQRRTYSLSESATFVVRAGRTLVGKTNNAHFIVRVEPNSVGEQMVATYMKVDEIIKLLTPEGFVDLPYNERVKVDKLNPYQLDLLKRRSRPGSRGNFIVNAREIFPEQIW